jgi:hypothetical protein
MIAVRHVHSAASRSRCPNRCESRQGHPTGHSSSGRIVTASRTKQAGSSSGPRQDRSGSGRHGSADHGRIMVGRPPSRWSDNASTRWGVTPKPGKGRSSAWTPDQARSSGHKPSRATAIARRVSMTASSMPTASRHTCCAWTPRAAKSSGGRHQKSSPPNLPATDTHPHHW